MPQWSTVEVPADFDEFQGLALQRGWGDGLPLVPPTEARVASMLRGVDWDADAVMARLAPNFAECTIAMIATNAVMAGCLPDHLPLLGAAVQAIATPTFNLYATQATTHPCGVMLLVSGPARAALHINGGSGALGPGWRANATIGRAIRLILQNLGGAKPGLTDLSTQGSPAKYTFCFGENDQDSPWPPYHVDAGFSADESVVTVLAAEAPHNINDHVSAEPTGILVTAAQTIATMGANNAYLADSEYFVGFCPEHAAVLGTAGWSRWDVRRYLYERARIPFGQWRQGGMYRMLKSVRWLEAGDDELRVPVTSKEEDIHIFVVGGPGRHSCWIPSFGVGRSVSRRIETADGSAWQPARPNAS